MGTHSSTNTDSEFSLIRRASDGDTKALKSIFDLHQKRLKSMVRLRLNRQLQGRVDASDVVQEAYLEVSKRLSSYLQDPSIPLFLWLRHITMQKLVDVHRQHLSARKRDAGREISLNRGRIPAASSAALAAQLLGRLTSPTQQLVKAELRMRVQAALENLDEIDREVLALRHFEQLTNVETAQVLGITTSGASSRYLRALKKMKNVLSTYSG